MFLLPSNWTDIASWSMLCWLLACATLIWGAVAVSLVSMQCAGANNVRVRRSWLMAGGVATGVGIWAGEMWAHPVVGSASLAALVALALTVSAYVGMQFAAAAPSPARRVLGTTGAACLHVLALGTAVFTLGLSMPTWWLPAMGAAGLVAHGALLQALRACGRMAGGMSPTRVAIRALAPAVASTLPGGVLAVAAGGALPTELGTQAPAMLLAAAIVGLAARATQVNRHLVGRHRRVRERLRETKARLERTPLADALTGLPNRLGLEAILRVATPRAQAAQERVVLLCAGLDGFRGVNDAYGQVIGDAILREATRRLNQVLRQAELPARARHLARVGGDEFVLMFQGKMERAALVRVAERAVAVLGQPAEAEGREVMLSASVGITAFPDDGAASRLLTQANAAMQAAKRAGGRACTMFEPHMLEDARERMELIGDLQQAVDREQLELMFQPKIDARSGQITAAEALLRWHHPTRGTIGPARFIALAESSGLVGALGNWVINEACRQARQWREQGLKMRVAINLSAYQMRQDDLVERIDAALRRHGVDASRLTCEITESVAMEDTLVTRRTFERLGAAGVHLSIDDFGTGYSSLAYLRHLPAAELKIDRSFVTDLGTSADAHAIVDAVIKLAHAIGLRVVAEGVETAVQRDLLVALGCDELQGYLFARPMSARALLLWAVDDDPARQAFRASLFADTNTPTTTPTEPGGIEPAIARLSLH